MTRDEIVRLAREAGFGPAVAWPECLPPFERFVALVEDAARLEGWRAAQASAAFVASEACLVPPDGGAPTQEEADLCDAAADAIRAMRPPTEWQCAEVAPVCGAATNEATMSYPKYPQQSGQQPTESFANSKNSGQPTKPWPHPDGFAGGLTERRIDDGEGEESKKAT